MDRREPAMAGYGAGTLVTSILPAQHERSTFRPSMSARTKEAPGENSPKTFLRQIMDSLEDGVYAVDRDRSIIFWNSGAERLTGYREEEVLGRSCADHILVHVDIEGNALCHGGCPMRAAILDGETRRTLAFFKHQEGHRVPVAVKVSPLHDDGQNRIGAIQVFSDNRDQLHSLCRRQDRVRVDAPDELTGLWPRRAGEVLVEETLQFAKLRDESVALILADIDKFQDINATYGHSTGDRVIRMLAATLRNTLRKTDIVVRWGGEEFVALLPGIGMTEAAELAETFRKMVQASEFQEGSRLVRATMSLGIAMLSRVDSMESWLGRARGCLNQAQQDGYNRVVLAAPVPREYRLEEPELATSPFGA